MAVSTNNPWEGIKISDVRLINPSFSWKTDHKFQLVIKNDNETRTSAKSAYSKIDLCVIWDESFFFAGELTDDSQLTFTIVRIHRLTPNNTIGSCKRRVIELLKIQSTSGPCKLDIIGICQLTFNIEKSSDVLSKVIENAPAASSTSLPNLDVAVNAFNFIDSAVQIYNDQNEAWSSFLLQFQVFMKVIDDVSEISPYVKIAWNILSVIPKIIITQKNRDEKIKKLCIKLKDIYDYITDAKRLHELTGTQSKALSVLVQQTIECAYFIRAYSTTNTVNNMVKGISGGVDGKIQGFTDKFDHLMKVITDSVSLETSIVTLRVSEKIGELNDLTLLGDIPYDSDAGFFPKKRCLPGTRQTLINEILEWTNSDTSPQILVLSGQAGVGKSAVAHTIAGIYQKQNRLGSMFCFNRSYTDRRNFLFSTISRDLADSDTLWRKELVNVINKSAVRKKKDAETQFEELIVKPSKNVETIGSVIIVVDALDESGDRSERKEILGLLLDRCSELPKNYRIIVTTRPEQDIELQCQNSNVLCKRMEDIDAEETRSDIQAYVSSCLSPLSSILDKIDGNWRSVLAKRAEGLFQWAQTVCKFMDPTVIRSKLVEKKWKTCISASSSSLYGLYHQIISSQSESQDADFIEDFKVIVGAIVSAREPLSINSLQNIFDGIEDIKSILTPFSSLFVGVHDLFTPVRPLHTSLFDFFVCKETNEYYIDASDQSLMTLACLKLTNRMLHFNLCHLETSHLRNQEIPDFSSRVEKAIPPHLSYSCRFWSFHLQSSVHSEELTCEIRNLFDINLLYYFEALSLLKTVHQGCVTMRELVDWCNDAESSLAADAMDIWEFGYEFGDAMTESTPHLYISALPFTPRGSFVSRNYLEKYHGLFTFDIGQPVSSSRKIGIGMQRHASTGTPTALAFSPKGRYIATGTDRDEFCIWNYITGERLVSEIRSKPGNDNHYSRGVKDIVYSPDGDLVYCCFAGGILVWNMKTKEMSVETYEMDYFTSCTISSDGCFITWNAPEEKRVLFDRQNHRIVDQFNGDKCRILAAAFSPNGDWLVFRRDSQTEVYIWNTRKQTQDAVFCNIKGDVALTDSYIAFQTGHTSIEIRDVRANTKIAEIQHPTYIETFQFSPDNQYILSSYFNVYSVWSVFSGELISRSYVDNISIHSLAFSHDSKSIALGTFDGTINVRQWEKSVEVNNSNGFDNGSINAIWLRATYLILQYVTGDGRSRLQISDTTATNTIVFEVELKTIASMVYPDEENVRVAYVTSRGLCLWNQSEGETVVDGSGQSITVLDCSTKYLISGDINGIIKIWDNYTRNLIGGPYTVSQWVRRLFISTTGTRFVIVYGDYMEIRECPSGGVVGGPFTSVEILFRPVAFASDEKHVICISKRTVNMLDASTGATINTISFSCDNLEWQLSPSGKYLTWIDNGEMKLLDMDTEISLKGPSLNQPAKKLWFSNDSRLIITASNEATSGNTALLDIWDMESKRTVCKTIQHPFDPDEIRALVLSNSRLIDSIALTSQCSIWDLDIYEKISSLYNPENNLLPGDGPVIEGLREPKPDKMEMLNYAIMAWKKASLPAFAKMNNGWVLGLQGELLFWIPEKRRKQFWYPCVMHIPCRDVTKLNFEKFVHGTHWTECGSS